VRFRRPGSDAPLEVVAGRGAAGCCALLWPFYVADEAARPSRHNLRILSYNVHSLNRHHADVLKFVREQSPDVAVFLEVSDVWADALAALADDWPHSLTRARSGNFGVALYSRMQLEGARIEYLSDRCPAVVAQVDVAGDRVTIFGVHPYPPMGRGATELRNRQLAKLTELVVSVSGETIVVGDLNTTSWSPAFTDFAGRTGLCDSRAGLGVQPSWPSAWPRLMRIPIDHCLVSPGIRVAQRRLGPDVGSDHLPLIADLLAGRNQSP
jgi:endonuclease/exonuclease/phosphatase (EEP) superfamily protein YafD